MIDIASIFKTFDENGDGYLTFEEVKRVIEKQDGKPLSPKDLETLRKDIQIADSNGNTTNLSLALIFVV